MNSYSRAPSSSGFRGVGRAQPRAAPNLNSCQPDLRQSMVVVVHPTDTQGDDLTRAVRRIGCGVELIWPAPSHPPLGFDFALVALDNSVLLTAPWLSGTPSLPTVAIIDGERGVTPEVLRLSNVQSILTKPFQSAALLANLIFARHVFNYEQRLQSKIAKLEETLHASRQIEQAKLIIMQQRKLRSNEAYDYLRRQAMTKQMSVAEISAALVDLYGSVE